MLASRVLGVLHRSRPGCGMTLMAWKVGAAETRFLESLESEAIPGGRRVAGRGHLAPDSPAHAVDGETREVACGFGSEALTVFDLDWESASLVERCPDCVRVVGAI